MYQYFDDIQKIYNDVIKNPKIRIDNDSITSDYPNNPLRNGLRELN